MLARFGRIFFVFLCGCAPLVSAAGDPIDNVPPTLRQTALCMLNILKTAPGIDSPSLGVSNRNELTKDDWIHPFLQYQYSDKSGHILTIRFEAQRSRTFDLGTHRHETYWFQAVLPGLMGPGKNTPYDWGTSKIEREWKKHCHITASTFYA